MSSRKDVRRTARERAAAEAAVAKARQQKKAKMLRIAAPVVVIVLVVAIGIAVQSRRASKAVDVAAPRPQGIAGVGGGWANGRATAPVIDVWEDFQCPNCKTFEGQTGTTLTDLADQGKARVIYHPLSFLDDNLDNTSSSRAANAFGCAIDAGAGADFHGVVFGNQPKEGVGFTDETLKEFGKNSGIAGAALTTFTRCVDKRPYAGWVKQVAADMAKHEVTGTPTMFINGKRYDYAPNGKLNPVYSRDGLLAAVAAAAAASPAPTGAAASSSPSVG